MLRVDEFWEVSPVGSGPKGRYRVRIYDRADAHGDVAVLTELPENPGPGVVYCVAELGQLVAGRYHLDPDVAPVQWADLGREGLLVLIGQDPGADETGPDSYVSYEPPYVIHDTGLCGGAGGFPLTRTRLFSYGRHRFQAHLVQGHSLESDRIDLSLSAWTQGGGWQEVYSEVLRTPGGPGSLPARLYLDEQFHRLMRLAQRFALPDLSTGPLWAVETAAGVAAREQLARMPVAPAEGQP
jgi:hypothetical protein